MNITTPRIIERIKKAFKCFMHGHDWTSDAAQNISLTNRQHLLLREPGGQRIVYNEQAHMYCKRCGTNSSLQLDDYVLDTFPPRNG